MSSIPWPFPKLGIKPALTNAAHRRVRQWARKRQGIDSTVTRLRPGRVYILPTGVGLVFGLMVFAMLMGSMNYNNNLSFVLTFILAGLGFVAMHQCQRNLVGLELSFAGVEPVFAGQAAQFRVAITNHSKNARHGIRLYTDDSISELQDLMPGESKVFVLAVMTDKRGRILLQRFGIRTLFPFELFRSWAWLHMNLSGLVTASTMRAVRRISRDYESFMLATRRVTLRGKPLRAAASYCPSSFPGPTRAASGSISQQFRAMTSNSACRY